jgi:hypothetical protein
MKALGLHKSFAKVSRDRATLAEGFRVAKLGVEHDISSLEAALQNAIAERAWVSLGPSFCRPPAPLHLSRTWCVVVHWL